MKLLVLGYHPLPSRLKDDELNSRTWNALSGYFTHISIIAQSIDGRYHYDRMKNIEVRLTPRTGIRIFDIILFLLFGGIFSFRVLIGGAKVIDLSEPVIAGPLGVFLKYITGAALLTELQGEVLTISANAYPLESVIRSISLWVCHNSTRIRVVSRSLYQSAIELGMPESLLYYIPNRVDLSLFHPCNKSTLKVSRSEETRFISIGSLIPVKGFDLLLRAFRLVAMAVPHATLHVIGSGQEASSLAKLASELGIDERVVFRGRINHTEIPKALNSSDYFVLSSLSEGMPRVILEAMACGIPVIATDVGGVAEVVENGVTGILVPPRNCESLADAMIKLSTDKALSSRLAENALSMIRLNHDLRPLIARKVDFIRGKNSYFIR